MFCIQTGALPPPPTPSCLYGEYGAYGVGVWEREMERERERKRERRGYEPLALHAPIHRAMLGGCDQEAGRWNRVATCSAGTKARPTRTHGAPG